MAAYGAKSWREMRHLPDNIKNPRKQRGIFFYAEPHRLYRRHTGCKLHCNLVHPFSRSSDRSRCHVYFRHYIHSTDRVHNKLGRRKCLHYDCDCGTVKSCWSQSLAVEWRIILRIVYLHHPAETAIRKILPALHRRRGPLRVFKSNRGQYSAGQLAF